MGGGRVGNDTVETANLLVPYEYQRKNCRVNNTNGTDPDEGDCTQQPATGLAQFGVDPNRNYGGFWGGPGAAPTARRPPAATSRRTTAATARSPSPRRATSATSSPSATWSR